MHHRMRLLRLLDVRTYQVSVFNEAAAPRYAAISHTWGPDEVVFKDLVNFQYATLRGGFAKLQGACLTVIKLGIEWIWIDTVCIDRSSSVEVSDSVNSIFRWFRNSQFCIVYLDDLCPDDEGSASFRQLKACRWMTRSWTLQEVIAPRDVRFFSRRWTQIGTKESLLLQISVITGVDPDVLMDADRLPDVSAGRKMSWAANRSTTFVEDLAYSLVGIFGLYTTVSYGEGSIAFIRLQKEILRTSKDATLFLWQATASQQRCRGAFAHSPIEFAHFATWPITGPCRIRGTLSTSANTVTIESPFAVLDGGDHGSVIAGFSGGTNTGNGTGELGILLQERDGYYVRLEPHRIFLLSRVPCKLTKTFCLEQDINIQTSNVIVNEPMCVCRPLFTMSRKESFSDRHRDLSYSSPDELSPRSWKFRVPGTTRGGRSDNVSEDMRNSEVAWSARSSQLIPGISDFRYQEPFNSRERVISGLNQNVQLQYQFCDELQPDNYSNLDSDELPSWPALLQGIGSGRLTLHDDTQNGDESLDDDIHLFISPPVARRTLPAGHDFVGIKEELANAALGEFFHCVPPPAGKRAGGVLAGPSAKRIKAASPSAPVPAAITQSPDPADADAVVVHKHPRRPPAAALACPFYARDPGGHRTCLTRAPALADVAAVKRHLWAEHRRPPFCPICRAVFGTAAARATHIRARTCEPRAGPDVEGVADDQLTLLAQRPRRGVPLDEQWFAVWDIVFPRTPRPDSAWLTGDVELLVAAVRQWWACKGQSVIAEFLEHKKLTGYEVRDEEAGLEALYGDVLDQVVDAVVDSFQGGDTEVVGLPSQASHLSGVKQNSSVWSLGM
jgi:hypothetical protein